MWIYMSDAISIMHEYNQFCKLEKFLEKVEDTSFKSIVLYLLEKIFYFWKGKFLFTIVKKILLILHSCMEIFMT